MEVALPAGSGPQTVVVSHTPGTEVAVDPEPLRPGATSQGLRVLRVRPSEDALRLVLEGRPGRTYELRVRSARRVEGVPGAAVEPQGAGALVRVTFDGAEGEYVRRELTLPLR